MTKDIICDESELSAAANKLSSYGDFLARTIEKYIDILDNLTDNGIQDALISSKLVKLAEDIEPYITTLSDECRNISSDIKAYISDIEDADDFIFPTEIMSTWISSIPNLFG